MKSIRQLIEQQQQRKAPKRTRKSSDFDDCSVFITQSERNDDEEPASDEDDTENRPLVQFQVPIHSQKGKVVPLFQQGLRSKYYEEALNAIKAVIAPNTPARIISDFETAMIRAMRETFPAAQLTGCLFHMSQAVFRKWREMGLAELYTQTQLARRSWRDAVGQTQLALLLLRRSWPDAVGETQLARRSWPFYY
ncbi:hypothetical protein niasHT_020848 [Heterodera trifolii]|uniref:MULE transposase domain-containing protein n=1 Tax=Heterodera trifolii TaxID=157864 RepID=A0ABD2KM14_9BILA